MIIIMEMMNNMDNGPKENWIEYSSKPSLRSYIIKKVIVLGKNFIKNKTLLQTRAMWDSSAKRQKVSSEFQIKNISIEDVNCEWILPKNADCKKTVIYLHGGGYVLGSLTTARSFALLISRYTGEKVLSVGYRLAPENPFPAGLNDSLSVYYKLLEQGTNPKDIIFAGDSAGGGMSLAVVLALKEKGAPMPGAVVCISPWTDLAATGESNKANAKVDPIFGSGGGVIKAKDYAGLESLFNPLISPLYGEYEGFPPLLIHVGTNEVILDDSVRLGQKAKKAGVQVSLKIWNGMWHVFTAQHNILPEARQSFKEIGEFVKGINS